VNASTRDTRVVAAYVVVDVEISDPERYSEYTGPVPESIAKHGGRFLARGGKVEVLEGDWQPRRLVVIEFPSMDAALGWYHSEDYQELAKIRWSASTANFVVVEGV
jgi:uncharacterized protein (DUF1330 family)